MGEKSGVETTFLLCPGPFRPWWVGMEGKLAGGRGVCTRLESLRRLQVPSGASRPRPRQPSWPSLFTINPIREDRELMGGGAHLRYLPDSAPSPRL